MKLRKSQAKDQAKVDARKQEIRAAYQAFLARARGLVARIEVALEALLVLGKDPLAVELREEIERFLPHAHRQIDQIPAFREKLSQFAANSTCNLYVYYTPIYSGSSVI